MNEIFDKFILRLIFALYLCLTIYFYKYAHFILYPASKDQLFRRFNPSKNPADTIHLISRIIGLGLVFSNFHISLSEGIMIAAIDFLIFATIGLIFYIISLYILESIVLYNFEYLDEVIKKKSLTYSLISLSHAISVGFLISICLKVSQNSIVLFFFLWLFSLVLIGIGTKTFPLVSKLSLYRQVLQKNIGVSFSYIGFIWGWVLLIGASLNHELIDVKWYAIHVVLKIILAMIIAPIFIKGLGIIFNIKDDFITDKPDQQTELKKERVISHGIYEGGLFLAACLLTKVITEQMNFGTFYPTFHL